MKASGVKIASVSGTSRLPNETSSKGGSSASQYDRGRSLGRSEKSNRPIALDVVRFIIRTCQANDLEADDALKVCYSGARNNLADAVEASLLGSVRVIKLG